MLISSTDPFRVYYHEGFLRVSLQAYDKNSTSLDVHLTNTSQSAKIIEKLKESGEKHLGMNLEEIEDFQIQTFEEYFQFLKATGKVTDESWLKGYFIPEIKKTMLASLMASKDHLYRNPGVYEMFGVDVILDENLAFHVIEINPSPMIISNISKKTSILEKMSQGMFDIVKAQ